MNKIIHFSSKRARGNVSRPRGLFFEVLDLLVKKFEDFLEEKKKARTNHPRCPKNPSRTISRFAYREIFLEVYFLILRKAIPRSTEILEDYSEVPKINAGSQHLSNMMFLIYFLSFFISNNKRMIKVDAISGK